MSGDPARSVAGLYGIVDLPWPGGAARALADALVDGGARVVQLRMKRAGAGEMLAAAHEVGAASRRAGALFIVNDRLDVALAAGADGVHLGQDDLPLADARALAPPGFVIGVSTHDLAQARAAVEAGADYIGFGPVFATRTKVRPDAVVGLAGLASACRAVGSAAVPVVAIGGIPVDAVGDVARAGAAAVAIISAINLAPDVAAAARCAAEAFASAAARSPSSAPARACEVAPRR